MPSIIGDLPIFQALGGKGGGVAATEYGPFVAPTFDLLGTKRLRRDSLTPEVVSTAGTSAFTSTVAAGFVRYIVAIGMRTISPGPVRLRFGLTDTGTGTFFALRDDKTVAQFEWVSLNRLPLYLPEGARISVGSTVALSLEIQSLFVDIPVGEYVHAPV